MFLEMLPLGTVLFGSIFGVVVLDSLKEFSLFVLVSVLYFGNQISD